MPSGKVHFALECTNGSIINWYWSVLSLKLSIKIYLSSKWFLERWIARQIACIGKGTDQSTDNVDDNGIFCGNLIALCKKWTGIGLVCKKCFHFCFHFLLNAWYNISDLFLLQLWQCCIILSTLVHIFPISSTCLRFCPLFKENLFFVWFLQMWQCFFC